MIPSIFKRVPWSEEPQFLVAPEGVTRVEIPLDSPDGTYNIILLDADDSFDIVVHYPNNQRECVWSLAKEGA